MYTVRLILDMVDAISLDEAKKLLMYVKDYVTEIYVYDKKGLYGEDVPKDDKIIYNAQSKLSNLADVNIYSTPLLLGKDGCVFIQLLPNIIESMSNIGVYEYEHTRIHVTRKIKKNERIKI